LVIALYPTAALAEDEPTDEQTAAANEVLSRLTFGRNGFTSDLVWTAHAEAIVQAGRDTGAKTSGGGEVAWQVGACKALFLGGEGAAERGRSQQAIASGSIWGGFCIPFPMNRMEFTLRSDYELQPRLSALPVALRSRFAGMSVQIRNTFVAWDSGTVDHELAPFNFTIGVFEQPTIDIGRGGFDIAAYRRTDTASGQQFAFLEFGMRAAGPAVPGYEGGVYLSTTAWELAPVRATGIPVGEGLGFDFGIDFSAGVAGGTISKPPASRMGPSEPLLREVDFFASTTLRASRGNDTFALAARRAFEPTFTEELLLDTRLDASWTRDLGKNVFQLGALTAVTQRHASGGVTDTTPSGGFRAAYVRRLWKDYAHLTLTGEVAHSFFAKLDDAPARDAEWAGQTSATLSIAR
jgi:hypothetical protein